MTNAANFEKIMRLRTKLISALKVEEAARFRFERAELEREIASENVIAIRNAYNDAIEKNRAEES